MNYADHSFVSYSALQCAALLGSEKMVSLLLRYGADPEFKGKAGLTALQLAKQKGYASIVRMLESAQTRPSGTVAPAAASSPAPPIY